MPALHVLKVRGGDERFYVCGASLALWQKKGVSKIWQPGFDWPPGAGPEIWHGGYAYEKVAKVFTRALCRGNGRDGGPALTSP